MAPDYYYPFFLKRRILEHYWGDSAREFVIGAVALMLLGAPFYVTNMKTQGPLIVLGALALVGCASLINPRNKYSAMALAVSAGAVAVVYGFWAVLAYSSADFIGFVLRMAPAMLLALAFYFSMKTVRAMVMGLINVALADERYERAKGKMIPPEAYHNPDAPTDALGNPAAPEVDRGGD